MMKDGLSEGMRFRRVLQRVVLAVGGLWLIHLLFMAMGVSPTGLGVRPGENPLPGILTAPLVHGSAVHLFSNTLPLLVLGTAMFFALPRASRLALPIIWLASGLAVWLFAREASHIGASGLSYGMMFFLFVAGVLRRDRLSMALALIVFFLYGGMIWGVLPQGPGVSFEYHLAGALSGAVCAFLLRHRDPVPLPPPTSFDDEEASEPGPYHPDEVEERARIQEQDPFQ